MADRIVRLMRSAQLSGTVVLTGGLSKDVGLVGALEQLAAKDKRVDVELVTHPDAPYAGAIGAALWAALRHRRLRRQDREESPIAASA